MIETHRFVGAGRKGGWRENEALAMDVESRNWVAVKGTRSIIRSVEWDRPSVESSKRSTETTAAL